MTFAKKLPRFLERHLPDFGLLLYVVAVTFGAFNGGLWMALGIGGAVIFFAGVCVIRKKIVRPPNDLAALVLAFLLTAGAMSFQSSQPVLSWEEWARLLTIFVPLLFLLSPSIAARIDHPRLFIVLPVALSLAGLALALKLYVSGATNINPPTGIRLTKYNRGFSYLVLMAFPVMAALWFSKKRWLIFPFLLLLFIPAGMTESRAAKLALLAGLPVVVLAHFMPLTMRRLLTAGTIAAVAWSFAAREIFAKYFDQLSRIPGSWRARLEIWDYMSYRIQEHPWLGWGLGTSYTLPFKEPHGAQYLITTMPAAHPHNAMTQLWVELGLPGLALGLVFAFLTLRKAGRLDPRLVPFALGAWTASFCLSMIAYDFWTDSLWAAFALTALAIVLLQNRLMSRTLKAAPKDRR